MYLYPELHIPNRDPTTTQNPNLALIETKRITVFFSNLPSSTIIANCIMNLVPKALQYPLTSYNHSQYVAVFRIRMFLGLPDPDPLVRCMDPDPSIIMQK
jgi:hypothetical protein